jgi:hypothetical protein
MLYLYIGNRTASLHETINLWTIVKPSCFAPDYVAHGFKTKKKKCQANIYFANRYNLCDTKCCIYICDTRCTLVGTNFRDVIG